MGWLYKTAIRPILFRMDPEFAHERGICALKLLSGMPWLCRGLGVLLKPRYPAPVHAFGLRFPNPVGLAAGMDKDGVAVPALEALGFGFVEVGTVTPKQQPGNPKPRIFRYPEEEAIINRMGFNNHGALLMAERLARTCPATDRRVPVGINIGKAKVTPLNEAVNDYLACFDILAPHADYFVVNVSSPNTQGLRDLQERDQLRTICSEMQRVSVETARRQRRAPWPILLKIAPDCTWEQIDAILEVLLEFDFAGVVATNTTIARPGRWAEVKEDGGLSGKPLDERATEVIAHIHRTTGGRLPIIGVGGIHDPDSAVRKMDAGAALIQVYTGFVYEGPRFATRLVNHLARFRGKPRVDAGE